MVWVCVLIRRRVEHSMPHSFTYGEYSEGVKLYRRGSTGEAQITPRKFCKSSRYTRRTALTWWWVVRAFQGYRNDAIVSRSALARDTLAGVYSHSPLWRTIHGAGKSSGLTPTLTPGGETVTLDYIASASANASANASATALNRRVYIYRVFRRTIWYHVLSRLFRAVAVCDSTAAPPRG